MSAVNPFKPTAAEIADELKVLLRDHSGARGLPADALLSAVSNRLRAQHHSREQAEPLTGASDSDQVLKSKGVTEVKEVIESNRRSAAAPEISAPTEPEPEPQIPPPDIQLPIARYISKAADHVHAVVTQGLLPVHQSFFQFVRVLKAHPKLSANSATTVLALVNKSAPGVEQWVDGELDDFEAAFYDAWDSVRLPAGAKPLAEAHRRAKVLPLALHPGAEHRRPPGYAQFISLAGWLCVVVGSNRVKLTCDAVGEQLGVSAMTVSRYRTFAIRDGYLVEIKRARYRAGGRERRRRSNFGSSGGPNSKRNFQNPDAGLSPLIFTTVNPTLCGAFERVVSST